jgi:hypothetical protein
MSDFVDPGVLRILQGGAVSQLTQQGVCEIGLACVSQAQEYGSLQIWGTADPTGSSLMSVDIFDDDFEILANEARWNNAEYASFFLQFPELLVTSFIDDNLAVDVNFETPTEFADSSVRQALIESLNLTGELSPLLSNLRAFSIAVLEGEL